MSTEEQTLRQSILRLDHFEHEDMAGEFQRSFNNDPENIPVLLQAIRTIPEYLHEDDFRYPYIRKLIYAIGAHPEPESYVALETLIKDPDSTIADLAAHQLEKRKRLGRWEQQK